PDSASAIHPQEVRSLKHPLAPAAEELPAAVKDHNRHRLIAVEDIDIAPGINVNAGRRLPFLDARRDRPPVLPLPVRTLRCREGRRRQGTSCQYKGGASTVHEFISSK